MSALQAETYSKLWKCLYCECNEVWLNGLSNFTFCTDFRGGGSWKTGTDDCKGCPTFMGPKSNQRVGYNAMSLADGTAP